MGNWRTVWIQGTCDPDEVELLKRLCTPDKDYSNFHCLSMGAGIMGLNNWVGEKIDAIGNLAERDYSIETVAETVGHLGFACPSLRLKVHCGGEHEDRKVVKTIVMMRKNVVIEAPEIQEIPEISEGDLQQRIINAMMNARRL